MSNKKLTRQITGG